MGTYLTYPPDCSLRILRQRCLQISSPPPAIDMAAPTAYPLLPNRRDDEVVRLRDRLLGRLRRPLPVGKG